MNGNGLPVSSVNRCLVDSCGSSPVGFMKSPRRRRREQDHLGVTIRGNGTEFCETAATIPLVIVPIDDIVLPGGSKLEL